MVRTCYKNESMSNSISSLSRFWLEEIVRTEEIKVISIKYKVVSINIEINIIKFELFQIFRICDNLSVIKFEKEMDF